jgi:hypothetical protein
MTELDEEVVVALVSCATSRFRKGFLEPTRPLDPVACGVIDPFV